MEQQDLASECVNSKIQLNGIKKKLHQTLRAKAPIVHTNEEKIVRSV